MVVTSELRTHKVMEAAIRELMGAGTPPRFKFKDTYASIEFPEGYTVPAQATLEAKYNELLALEEDIQKTAIEGDLEVGTSNLYVDTETGNVGIGTTSPQVELDVSGVVNVSSNLEVGTSNLFVDTETGRVGIGNTNPGYNLDVNGSVRITGGLLISSIGTQANPIMDLRELYGKASGNYYVRFFNGTISQHYWDGLWLKIHEEGLNADQYTSYWSHSTVQQMSNFGGLGSGYGHGWDVNANSDLTLTNLPPHSHTRYSVKWHFVDSIDREDNALEVYDFRSYNERERMWYGNRNISDVGMNVRTLYHHTTASFTVATYSYEPWNGAGTVTLGYETIDTGPIPHSTPRFKVRHYTATNQAVSDEAIYYTHSTIWIK